MGGYYSASFWWIIPMGNELRSGDLVTWGKGAELHPNDPWVGEIESVVQFAGGIICYEVRRTCGAPASVPRVFAASRSFAPHGSVQNAA